MLPESAREALSTLTAALAAQPELEPAVRVRWHAGSHHLAGQQLDTELPRDLVDAAELLGNALPALTHIDEDVAELGALFADPSGVVLFSWLSASAWRRDTAMAKLLAHAAKDPAFQ